MNRRLITGFVSVALLAITAFFFLPTAPPAVDVTTHSIVVDNVERSYRIAIANELPEIAPVVFAFHGIGDTPESMATYSRLD